MTITALAAGGFPLHGRAAEAFRAVAAKPKHTFAAAAGAPSRAIDERVQRLVDAEFAGLEEGFHDQ